MHVTCYATIKYDMEYVVISNGRQMYPKTLLSFCYA